jgi:hypothetical protein
VKNVELTISVKRGLRGNSPDILGLIAGVPGVEVLGGDPHYAVDVRIPSKAEQFVIALVKATCDVEPAAPLHYLTARR